ncbi:hypothetical protein L914_19128 [Phytophthora nicotianae]|uniref:Uncharacterized protein n=1 Tax=Phytophthora nicotianae TaxID=4792 RepID=W2MDA3_PHYNI|nr:hypothetical protein L914_19128 [Phytophthora nicotianae]
MESVAAQRDMLPTACTGAKEKAGFSPHGTDQPAPLDELPQQQLVSNAAKAHRHSTVVTRSIMSRAVYSEARHFTPHTGICITHVTSCAIFTNQSGNNNDLLTTKGTKRKKTAALAAHSSLAC